MNLFVIDLHIVTTKHGRDTTIPIGWLGEAPFPNESHVFWFWSNKTWFGFVVQCIMRNACQLTSLIKAQFLASHGYHRFPVLPGIILGMVEIVPAAQLGHLDTGR